LSQNEMLKLLGNDMQEVTKEFSTVAHFVAVLANLAV
jgi:hypothetical protein